MYASAGMQPQLRGFGGVSSVLSSSRSPVNALQRSPLPLFILFVSVLSAQTTQTPTVGGGAPNPAVSEAFVQAYFQNGFNNLVAATPDANVSPFGSTGYYQQFSLATSSTVKLALVLPTISTAGTDGAVLQVLDPMYSYYAGITVGVAGYPNMSTQNCPGVANCQYQFFSNNYALFYYSSGNPNGNGFSVSGAIYTAWNNLGGPASSLGLAYNAQATVTSPAKTTATAQVFTNGEVVALTSGINSGSAYSVVAPVYAVYSSAGGPTGLLGMPTSNDLTLSDGSHKQTFEAGRIVYTPGNAPTILLPVNEIDISPLGSVTLQYGQTLTATVSLFDSGGGAATGRVVDWSTSNGSAVSVMGNGYSAVLKAVGSGIASITATSEGIVSKAIVVTAVEPCCQIGQGAPAAVQSAFQAAIARTKINVLIPAAAAARVAGAGYVQDLYSPDGTIHYLLAESNSSQTAYVVTGSILAAYTTDGGPTGLLGYPTSDLSAGGTQLFQGGALAGSPVELVAGSVLTKWAATNYESGPLGIPVAAQTAFTSQSGYTGFDQSFAGGAIFGFSNGSLTGQGFQSNGLILARYLALSGPAGEMGAPLSDPSTVAGVARQNFENGYIDLQPGASAAVEHLNPRVPAITITPATVLPGSHLHFSITGFNNGASLSVSQSGQPNFLVTVPAGSYSWDAYIAAGASAGTITVKAVDSNNSSLSATGVYTIRSITAAQPQLNKSQGDNQTAPPGSTLSTPLTVTLTDSTGTPISGATVTFSASPGAAASPNSAVTDSTGRASTSFRLPAAPGIAAVTAQALGQIAIFDAQSSGSFSLPNYPQFVSVTATGTQVASAASMIRYYQNLASMAAPNGQATPAALDQFLQTLPDGYLNSSQLVNFWRLINFTGGNLFVSSESADLGTVRTLTAGGDPVLLSLGLTQDGSPSGGTTVVATGIAADGTVTILDPNPTFARVDLDDYLTGFTVNSHAFRGTILSALRLLPRATSPTAFLLDAISQPLSTFPSLAIQSAAGGCNAPLTFQDPYLPATAPPSSVLASQFVYCDGSQPIYQASVGSPSPYRVSFIDLSVPDTAASGAAQNLTGSAVTTYQVSRSGGQLSITRPAVSFSTSSILNAASFLPGVSPGGLFSIFGSGLAGGGPATAVSVGGISATVLLATPFQINAQIPEGLPVGSATVQVTSPYGTSSQSVALQATSPGIFIVGTASDGVSSLGAVVNQNGAVNGSTSPAPRGSTVTIYCTGLGATSVKNGLSVATGPVSAVISNTSLPVAFAGLTPGFVGLYQVNLLIPAATPPGLLLPATIQAGGISSNTVVIAVQ
jgi:uncharacterized protein (TIGR03437 family)